jgi:formylglycine-generating enzyme required for sulfatase activity
MTLIVSAICLVALPFVAIAEVAGSTQPNPAQYKEIQRTFDDVVKKQGTSQVLVEKALDYTNTLPESAEGPTAGVFRLLGDPRTTVTMALDELALTRSAHGNTCLRISAWAEKTDADGIEIARSKYEETRCGIAAATEEMVGQELRIAATHLLDRLGAMAIEPDMVTLSGGLYRMGDLTGKEHLELPVHSVAVRHFAIARYEVTFREYDAFVADTGRHSPSDEGWGRGSRPVINVSWDDAVAYAQWLSAKTGKSYRLPTEAEWEYAARAGSVSAYWWGDDIAVGGSEWRDRWTAPVGSFTANAFGLHDILGNVEEWVQDCWHSSYEGAPDDGSAWLDADNGKCDWRVVRGGAWLADPVHTAYRSWYEQAFSSDHLGFRLARDFWTPVDTF